MTASNVSDGVTSGLSPQARRAVVVVLVGAVLAFLDATIVNVALKSLAAALGCTLDAIGWVVTAYLLAQVAVLPLSGWAARRVGPRRLYVAALTAFTLASLGCGLAGSLGILITARIVQGVGAGLMIPAGQLILVLAAGRAGMARAMVAAGIPMILTPVIGPTVGGLLLEYAGWQWIFLINIPFGVLGLVLALRLLPADGPREAAGPLDVVGLGLISFGTVGITYGLAQAGADSVTGARVLAPLLAGTVSLVLFVAHGLRSRHAVLDLGLWRDRVFAAAAVTTLVLGAVTFGAMILLPLYFQLVRHQDAAHTGMLLAPQGIGAAVAMVLSARLYERIGARTCVLGAAIGVAATVPFLFLSDDTSYWLLALAMIVRGLGIGLAATPAMTAALQDLSPDRMADATPQLNIMQRIGGSIGTAVFIVVLQQGLRAGGGGGASDAFATTFGWVLTAAILALLPTSILAMRGRSLTS
ncbi:DHA2 family efflux MFS transporter permease subunit [Nocardia sp. NPDC020380]|uniref:DHA2 family efflux MFS transporter permease subunit n=1 Tax=Nocardia sp. NPDC020380 TaxID=3364309 RepID=UPI0037AA927B